MNVLAILLYPNCLVDESSRSDSSAISGQEALAGSRRSPTSPTLPPLSDSEASTTGSVNAPLSQTLHPAGVVSSSLPRRSKRNAAPNFRDFPAHQSPFSPRSFATALPSTSAPNFAPTADVLFTAGPTGEPIIYAPEPMSATSEEESYDPRHPPHLSEVVSEAFADTRSTLLPGAPDAAQDPVPSPAPSTSESESPPPPSNFSQAGIVHLLPLEDRSDSPYSSVPSSSGRRLGAVASRSRSGHSSAGPHRQLVAEPSGDPSRSSSNDPSSAASHSESGTSRSSAGPHMTLRYKHVEDEDGHHLIVGREGQLTRCEDEVRSVCLWSSTITNTPCLTAYSYTGCCPRVWCPGCCRRRPGHREPARAPGIRGELYLSRHPSHALTLAPRIPRNF